MLCSTESSVQLLVGWPWAALNCHAQNEEQIEDSVGSLSSLFMVTGITRRTWTSKFGKYCGYRFRRPKKRIVDKKLFGQFRRQSLGKKKSCFGTVVATRVHAVSVFGKHKNVVNWGDIVQALMMGPTCHDEFGNLSHQLRCV